MASNQAAAAAPKPLAMMTKLSPFVSFLEPDETSVSQALAKAPKVILIASWMDARDVHIAKYVTRYQALYPTSKILLVKFFFKQILWKSEAVKLVQPAVSYFRSQMDSGYLSASPSRPEILIHTFSNAGTASTKHMLDIYEEKTGHAFPLHTAVYDSCPGLYSYWGAYNATIAGVPKGIWRWIMGPIIHLLDMYLWFRSVVLRLPLDLQINGDAHNNPKKTQQTNRTYIYGTADEMVDWNFIELHAKQAKAKGFAVRMELFTGSPHVAHMRTDPGRYWKIVTETWEKAVTGA